MNVAAIARWAISKFIPDFSIRILSVSWGHKKRGMKERFSDDPNVRKTSLGGLPSLPNLTDVQPDHQAAEEQPG
ncbi:MAG: hypothetical protein ACFB0G_24670 [Leptolyngbyaceae cyanobacterium]